MSRISPLSYYKVTKKLTKLGFRLRRATKGSHEIWWNSQTTMTCVVPHHKEIKVGTLRSIIRQAGVHEDVFLEI